MQSSIPITHLAAACLWFAFTLTGGAVFAQSRISLDATKDAYVYGRDANQNFGNDPELSIKKSKNGKDDRRCYLQFELPKTTAPIRFAMLDCTITKSAKTSVKVGYLFEDWNETKINWNNCPTNQEAAGKAPALAGGRLLVDITKAIEQAYQPQPSQRSKTRLLTLVISADKSSQSSLHLASNEDPVSAQRPKLILETGTQKRAALQTSVAYTATEKGTFAGLRLGKSSAEPRLGKYGGWKNWKMKATGFFRTEHIKGNRRDPGHWILVDPQGFRILRIWAQLRQ